MHILVVDPNVAFGTLLSEELLRLGYTVDQVISGAEALQCAQDNAPSLAILDMALEAPDALTVAAQLREFDASLRLLLIPLIGESLQIDEKSLPIQGVLPKPFFLPELPMRISSALGIEVTEEEAAQLVEDWLAQPVIPPLDEEPASVVNDAISFIEPVKTSLFADRDHGFQYIRYQNNADRVRNLLETLIFEIGADSALLTLDEHLLTWVGEFAEAQAESIAKVVIQGWRSSEEMARILGREQLQFEQSIAGGSYMLYALSIDINAIMAVAIRGTATLGMIRIRAREVAGQISKLCSVL
jgi:CheY-like chemotaxis protein